jgi:hypothetical protein
MNDKELVERLFAKGLLVLRSERIVDHDESTRVSWIEHGETKDMDISNETYAALLEHP